MNILGNRPIKVFALAAVMVFMSTALAGTALATITISGTVTNSGGTPLSGISLGLFRDNCYSEGISGTSTDGNGFYSFPDIPEGTYYVGATDNPDNPNCGIDYVSEYWNDSESEPHSCNNATSISTTRSDVDFSLQAGYSITGTVYDGAATVSDIYISLILGEACDGEYALTVTSDGSGNYCITVPPGGPYYLQADPAQSSQDYAQEWYTSTGGTVYSDEAEGITITSSDVPDTDFDLDDGGSFSGIVKDNTGSPVVGILVSVYNDVLCFGGSSTTTDGSGNFMFPSLAPGPWEISIQPAVSSGLAQFNREYWLNSSQDRELGTITLQSGALISGTFVNTLSAPVPDLDSWFGGKFDTGWSWAEDGSFEFRLPQGTYNLNVDPMDEGYTMPYQEITVTAVDDDQHLGNLTVYDDSTGATITGSVTDSAAHAGDLIVVAFSDSQEYTPDKYGGLGPQGMGIPQGGTYSLFVPPSRTIDLYLVLYSEDIKCLESVTVVDSETGISAPASGGSSGGHNLAYTSQGYTVDGLVKESVTEAAIYGANVLLYAQPGDQFTGFTESDETGSYQFYNVPAGDYKLAVTHPDYPDQTVWSDSFHVSGAYSADPMYLEVPSSASKSMPWLFLLFETE